jgi:hypothetical protein
MSLLRRRAMLNPTKFRIARNRRCLRNRCTWLIIVAHTSFFHTTYVFRGLSAGSEKIYRATALCVTLRLAGGIGSQSFLKKRERPQTDTDEVQGSYFHT